MLKKVLEFLPVALRGLVTFFRAQMKSMNCETVRAGKMADCPQSTHTWLETSAQNTPEINGFCYPRAITTCRIGVQAGTLSIQWRAWLL